MCEDFMSLCPPILIKFKSTLRFIHTSWDPSALGSRLNEPVRNLAEKQGLSADRKPDSGSQLMIPDGWIDEEEQEEEEDYGAKAVIDVQPVHLQTTFIV